MHTSTSTLLMIMLILITKRLYHERESGRKIVSKIFNAHVYSYGPYFEGSDIGGGNHPLAWRCDLSFQKMPKDLFEWIKG